MCILIAMRPGGCPTRGQLERATANNPDGNGYAIVAGDQIITGKSLTNKEGIITEFLALREMFPDGPALFHARIGTEGERDDANCHPFPLGEKSYLAHNGIFGFRVPKGDPRSDTRFLAEELAPFLDLRALDCQPYVWETLCETGSYTYGNKVAILTVDPRLERQLYILGESQGHWNDEHDIWWSNRSYSNSYMSWKTAAPSAGGTISNAALFDCRVCGKPDEECWCYADEEEEKVESAPSYCPGCDAIVTPYSLLHEYCEYCQTCLSCHAAWNECQCEPSVEDHLSAITGS